MARSRREVQTLDPLPPEDEEEILQESPLDANVERFLIERASGISDAQVKVYRAASQTVPGKAGQLRDAWLYSVTPEEFAEEFLQLNYGAGAYRIKMYGTANGKYCMLINRILEIGPPPPSQAKDLPAPASALNGGVTVNAPGSGADIARAIAEANAPIFAALTTLIQTMTSGGGRKAMLEEMQLMAAMFKPAGGDNKTSLMEAISLAEKISGLGKGGSDIDSESGPWLVLREAVAQLGGPVGQMLENSMNRHGGKNGARQLPAPSGAAVAGETQQAPAGAVHISEEVAVAAGFRMQIAMLLNAAASDADAELYGELIYQQAPEEIITKLQGEKWFEDLCALEPRFSEFKPWAEKVRAVVLEELQVDAAPDGSGSVSPNPDKAGSAAVDKK